MRMKMRSKTIDNRKRMKNNSTSVNNRFKWNMEMKLMTKNKIKLQKQPEKWKKKMMNNRFSTLNIVSNNCILKRMQINISDIQKV